MTATKECKKCGIDKPATSEYFYRHKQCKDGLNTSCKSCIRKYRNNYYSNQRLGVKDKHKSIATFKTTDDYKVKILKKYKIGQVVTLKYRDKEKRVKEKRKAEIIKFYPHHVLCVVDNCRESFTYVDLAELTRHKKGDKWHEKNLNKFTT